MAQRKRLKNIEINENPGLMNAYLDRFKSFEDPIFKSMLWMNPANWDVSDPKYAINDILFLTRHFEIPFEGGRLQC